MSEELDERTKGSSAYNKDASQQNPDLAVNQTKHYITPSRQPLPYA